MSSTKELSSQLLDKKTVSTLSKSVKAEPEQVQLLIAEAVPVLLQSMSQNATSTKGADSLNKALDKHAKTKVTDLSGFLADADKDDGEKILNNILGDNTKSLTTALAKDTGMKSTQVKSLLSTLAPLLLSLLGNQKQQSNTSASGLASMLSLVGGSSSNNSNGNDLLGTLVGSFLGGGSSSNNSGNLLGSLLGGGSSSNNSGNLLGSLLGCGSSSNSNNNNDLAGNLLGSLLGGGSSSNNNNNNDLAGNLLGSLLGGGSSSNNNSNGGSAVASLLSNLLTGK